MNDIVAEHLCQTEIWAKFTNIFIDEKERFSQTAGSFLVMGFSGCTHLVQPSISTIVQGGRYCV